MISHIKIAALQQQVAQLPNDVISCCRKQFEPEHLRRAFAPTAAMSAAGNNAMALVVLARPPMVRVSFRLAGVTQKIIVTDATTAAAARSLVAAEFDCTTDFRMRYDGSAVDMDTVLQLAQSFFASGVEFSGEVDIQPRQQTTAPEITQLSSRASEPGNNRGKGRSKAPDWIACSDFHRKIAEYIPHREGTQSLYWQVSSCQAGHTNVFFAACAAA